MRINIAKDWAKPTLAARKRAIASPSSTVNVTVLSSPISTVLRVHINGCMTAIG